MSRIIQLLILTFIISQICCVRNKDGWVIIGGEYGKGPTCYDNVYLAYEYPSAEKPYATLYVNGKYPENTKMILKFNETVKVTGIGSPDETFASLRRSADPAEVTIKYFQEGDGLYLTFKGLTNATTPFVDIVVVNATQYDIEQGTGYICTFPRGITRAVEVCREYCNSASINLINYIEDKYGNMAGNASNSANIHCGRRLVTHTGLIVNGLPTKPGDWPWHAAFFVIENGSPDYFCGGTLISKSMVLTAAHCMAIRGVPRVTSSLSVVLGKYNLLGGDIAPQEREVQDIIIHESFVHKNLSNDIALVKLKTECMFDDYVQPACLWSAEAYKRVPSETIYGTVVGWGFDNSDKLSTTLQRTELPMISEITCIRSKPTFFAKFLDELKFCAGYNNGTSACNGDSGGGFMVFVPDSAGATGVVPGAWHVRGIVSMSISRTDGAICNPNHYGLFTDVSQYRGWVLKHLQ